jgi:hypothetical protein
MATKASRQKDFIFIAPDYSNGDGGFANKQAQLLTTAP